MCRLGKFQPCMHGARCTSLKFGGYTCSCPPDTTGPNCEFQNRASNAGEWSVWQPWGKCEGVCGTFFQLSSRTCTLNMTCYGASQRKRACPITEPCQADHPLFRDYDVFYESLLNQTTTLTVNRPTQHLRRKVKENGVTMYTWVTLEEAFNACPAFRPWTFLTIYSILTTALTAKILIT